MWNLPTYVKIDDIEYEIRNKCDYRVVLDVIAALNDNELEIENRIECALFIFYENSEELTNIDVAIKEMFKIINWLKNMDNFCSVTNILYNVFHIFICHWTFIQR